MNDIIRSDACRNSPKNTLMQEVAIAILTGNTDWLAGVLAENACLYPVNGPAVPGRGAICLHVARHADPGPDRLTIQHAIAHGRVGMANASVERGAKTLGSCVVVEFANTSAKTLATIRMYAA